MKGYTNALQGARSASRTFEEPVSVSPTKWIPSELDAKRDPVRFFNAIRWVNVICCRYSRNVPFSSLMMTVLVGYAFQGCRKQEHIKW